MVPVNEQQRNLQCNQRGGAPFSSEGQREKNEKRENVQKKEKMENVELLTMIQEMGFW